MTRRLDNPPTLEEWEQWAADSDRNWTINPVCHHTNTPRSGHRPKTMNQETSDD